MKTVTKQGFHSKGNSIKDKNGKTLTEEKEILNRWKEYGSSLFESTGAKTSFSTESLEKEPEPLFEEVMAAFK